MSRSVSAPSSVTNTSPCWYGLIVPGSTLMYGSNFCSVTRYPCPSSRHPTDAAARPLPSEETTPPVTKMYLVVRPVIWALILRPVEAGRYGVLSRRRGREEAAHLFEIARRVHADRVVD